MKNNIKAMVFFTELSSASASFDGDNIKVSTGKITRIWTLCSQGLSTIHLQDESTGKTYISTDSKPDWEIFTLSDIQNPSKLIGISQKHVPADTFTSEHLLIECDFEILSKKIALQYTITAYPDISGIRTQLSLKLMEDADENMLPSWLLESYTERLSLNINEFTRIPSGYYNDTQHRYHADLNILKEEYHKGPVKKCEIYDWCNHIALENSNGQGIVLLKENHKCINQSGIDTGHFKLYPDAICSTGLGLKSHYADRKGNVGTAWATWCLLYDGGDLGRQKVLKTFDAAHFPFRYSRDGNITSNTWGSRGAGEHSRSAASEESVLQEIERAAEIGIDCVQIDDGWEIQDSEKTVWKPCPECYPQGWDNVKLKAKELGVKLGIWFSWGAPLKDMICNVREGGFTQVKLDFLDAKARWLLDEFYLKAKTLSEINPDIQINADLTEQEPRFGYYYGRKYCSLFPQNIELCFPEKGIMGSRHIIYTPWLTLRQSWHFAKYMNLNQLQLSTQNIDMIPLDWSDASLHTHDYCFAITMMGLPLFFLETKFYSEKALSELKPILRVYRKHRASILSGIVYPIGDEPSNSSITGFQSHNDDDNSGYLTLFRELNASEGTFIKANFLAEKKILLTDIVKEQSTTLNIDKHGNIPIALSKAASYQFLHYQIV